MKIHHLRNATFIIESNERFILVDPFFGKKASAAPLSFFRFKARRNPLVALPENAAVLLDKVTHCLITHLHPDHLDAEGIQFLKERQIPVVCSAVDEKKLQKKGVNIDRALRYNEQADYLGGEIRGIKAIHGYGFVKAIAGSVMGFHLELSGDCSIYISSDTVYTSDVDRILREYKPDVTVLAAGMAQLDIGNLLLMNEEDIIRFVTHSPGKVYANHMEALNHCPHTRDQLRVLLTSKGLLDKVVIPADGEMDEYLPGT